MDRQQTKSIARNRKARFEYEILDEYEAGIELKGSEVKSLRQGKASIEEAFIHHKNGEVFVHNMYIAPYSHSGSFRPDPRRPRKLLLHKRQIRSLISRLERRGATCIPLSLYFKGNLAKLRIALVKHRSRHDKREKLKERASKREINRYLKNFLRR